MSNEEFGKKLLFSMPPMESKDTLAVAAELKRLNAFQEDFMKELSEKQCVDPSPEGSGQIEQIKTKLEEYQQGLYAQKGVTARHNVVDQGDSMVAIRTYAEHLDMHNCCTGYWAAEWSMKILNEKEVDMGGKVSLHVYYFEDGANVQMRATRDFETKPVATEEEVVHSLVAKFEKQKMSYDEQLAKKIVDQLAKYEKELYTELKGMGDEIDGSLKKLRRILPITKTRFKWDSAAQKQVRLLNARKTE